MRHLVCCCEKLFKRKYDVLIKNRNDGMEKYTKLYNGVERSSYLFLKIVVNINYLDICC